MEIVANTVFPGTVKQGYLTKSPPLEKSSGIKLWKKRFCILYKSGADYFFQYYKNEDSAWTSLPKDVVPLKSCTGIKKEEDFKSHKNVFSVDMPGRVYYFSALTHEEMDDWVHTFCRVLKMVPQIESTQSKTISTRPLPPTPEEVPLMDGRMKNRPLPPPPNSAAPSVNRKISESYEEIYPWSNSGNKTERKNSAPCTLNPPPANLECRNPSSAILSMPYSQAPPPLPPRIM